MQNSGLACKSIMVRRKKEINHVSAAYFTNITIKYGFGERLRVFHALFGETFAVISRGLNRGSSNIKNCFCGAVVTLLSILKC